MNAFFKLRQHSNKGGMVLFELVIALTVFTLVAFSLISALDAAFSAERDRLQIDSALRGMENQLALLHAKPIAPVDQDIPDDGTGITYHLSIEPEQMQDQKKQPVPGMYRATVTAKWKFEGQANDRTISEILYQP